MQTRYRNTDLDLVSATPLDQLGQQLEAEGMIVLGNYQDGQGLWNLVLEITGDENDQFHDNADATIVAMLDILERLPEQAGNLLRKCQMREFNTAYDVGDEPLDFNECLNAKTILRMASFNMSFRVTLYSNDQ